MKLIAHSILISLLLLVGSSCNQENVALMRVGTNVWPGYEPLYVAREKGWLEQKHIKLIEYPSASEVIRAFRNKTLEAASLTLDEVIQLSESKVPVKVVLVHDISAGADVIIAKSGINSMQDLKGRRIGVESGALGAYMLTRALETHGMTLSDIKVVHMDVNLHESSFVRGRIDAVVTFEPVRTKLLSQGGKEIFTSKEIPGEVVDVLVVHEDYLSMHRDNVNRLVDVWFDALAYKREDMEGFAEISSRRLKVSTKDVIDSYNGLLLPGRDENQSLLGGDNPKLQQTLLEIRRVLEQNGLVEKGIMLDDLLAPL
ncbi:MAG: ABC transporter substrate-binding protein [Gammaproteobacteria bacterium]|nr:ABC transporter substrate-binding protein [Gammaproteobacteria bacterium]